MKKILFIEYHRLKVLYLTKKCHQIKNYSMPIGMDSFIQLPAIKSLLRWLSVQ